MTKLETETEIPVNVENIEDVITESLGHIGRHPEHVIHTELPQTPVFVIMNPQMIMQVTVNLLNNALKYTPAGSEITVSVKKKNGEVAVAVTDNGNGIPDEEKKRIFDLFYTGKHSSDDSYRSMGIGLNLCALILKAHHSRIEVHDHAPHGAEFVYYLEEKEVEA